MALAKIHFHRIIFEFLWGLRIKVPLHDTQVKGWFGEWLAKDYLIGKKFKIIQKNWHSPYDFRKEIDLIAMNDECLVFIEVRARSQSAINSGYFSLNYRKRKSLLGAFNDFLKEHDGAYPIYRFDVIEVDLGSHWGKVFHHENVSLFP